MSIHPVFAQAAYGQTKKFEYRRCGVGIATGDTVFIYETSPTRKVTGQFKVGRVVVGTPAEISTLESAPAIQPQVARYLAGAKRCSAMEILNPLRWENAKEIDEMWPGRSAPQSYCFVRQANDELLRNPA